MLPLLLSFALKLTLFTLDTLPWSGFSTSRRPLFSSTSTSKYSFMSQGISLICGVSVSTGVQHPYVPQCFQLAIFDALHSISIPGIHAMQRNVTMHFVWPSVNRDVCQWPILVFSANDLKSIVMLPRPTACLPYLILVFSMYTLTWLDHYLCLNGCVYLLSSLALIGSLNGLRQSLSLMGQ